jgi:hypothetical protein
MKKVMLTFCLLVLSAGRVNAQGYASMEPYRADIAQARIKAAATQTLMGYRLLEYRYEMASRWLSAIAAHPRQGKVVGPGGRMEVYFRYIESGAVSFEAANAHIAALESVVRRAGAGQAFDYRSAERFLGEAQRQLFAMQMALIRQEQATYALARAVSKSTGTGLIRWDTAKEMKVQTGYRELTPVK